MLCAINENLDKKEKEEIEREIYNELLKEFKAVNSRAGLDDFFKKFMTNGEKNLIFRRIAAIKMIKRGKKYREITEGLRISRGTISNAADILKNRGYGMNPDRKRRYSTMPSRRKNKIKPIFRKYKGAESII